MPTSHIYQIFYSQETRNQLDPGFIALDNRANERPEWREYWPIRQFLIENTLLDGHYYGFFSPKFKRKTHLDSAAVHAFVNEGGDSHDVMLFSPYFDQSAFYFNIFEQGSNQHPGLLDTFKQAAALIAPGIELENLITDSRNTVFCNYFVAKPRFWMAWFDKCERLFSAAEKAETTLGERLNFAAQYKNEMREKVQAKVFVLERVATLLLATQPDWKVTACHPALVPFVNAPLAGYLQELKQLDALKIAAITQRSQQHIEAFTTLRDHLVQNLGRK